jgi:hypothetical protein
MAEVMHQVRVALSPKQNSRFSECTAHRRVCSRIGTVVANSLARGVGKCSAFVIAVGCVVASYGNNLGASMPQMRIGILKNSVFAGDNSNSQGRDNAQQAQYPVAVIAGPLASTVGAPVVADPTGSQPGKSGKFASSVLEWGDGEQTTWSGAPAAASHVYTKAGTFGIVLTVTANNGKSANAKTSASVTLAPSPAPAPAPAPVPAPAPAPSAGTWPLVDIVNLVHEGWFSAPDGFDYQGTALGFNPAKNSLFIASGASLGEISIPALGGRSTLLQSLTDPAEGASIGASDTRIGGTLVRDGQLYFTKYIYYDATASQTQSLFVRPLDLSATGQVHGPYQVGPLETGFYSGYMTSVPAGLQSPLGGPVLTGNCCLNIITRTSFGPAAFAIDPPTAIVQQNAAPLGYYPSDHPTLGPWNAANQYYGGSDSVTGVVVPEGFGSVLFFGQHGTTFCYGDGATCNDPVNPYQGVHGYPYLSYVWAYRVSDLADVRAGLKAPWDVLPYGTWTLTELNGSRLGGVAYDAATKRIFVSQTVGDGPRPLIHVYTVR